MNYSKLIEGMKRFGSTERDICEHGLHVAPGCIQENAVIAPWWEPNTLPGLGEAERLSPSENTAGVWNIKNGRSELTYIKTGIGAPMLLESSLPLGMTKCKRIIFVGSVGSLALNVHIAILSSRNIPSAATGQAAISRRMIFLMMFSARKFILILICLTLLSLKQPGSVMKIM